MKMLCAWDLGGNGIVLGTSCSFFMGKSSQNQHIPARTALNYTPSDGVTIKIAGK